jgi:hypothetical protein
MFQKSYQVEKQPCIEPAGRNVEGRISPVRPLTRNAETTDLALAENQSIDASYTPLLEHFKALASKRVKRMTDLRPSQI